MLSDQRKGTGRKRKKAGSRALGEVLKLPKQQTIIKDRLIEVAGWSDDKLKPEVTFQHSILC